MIYGRPVKLSKFGIGLVLGGADRIAMPEKDRDRGRNKARPQVHYVGTWEGDEGNHGHKPKTFFRHIRMKPPEMGDFLRSFFEPTKFCSGVSLTWDLMVHM